MYISDVDILICVSHLRWDFVWQRPQHLLSRFAKHLPILYIEEPLTSNQIEEPYLEILPPEITGTPNVTVIRLIQPSQVDHWIGHGDSLTQSTYVQLLQTYLPYLQATKNILWFYTPMALDFAKHIPYQLLIFDVMDQLSKFKGAPQELEYKERELLQKADIIFTGGLSLYNDKCVYNPNTYLFPSGVEIEHFAQAADHHHFSCPIELANLNGTILGYFGVIDERMDIPLISILAQVRPDWHIVLIGPIVKINPHDLPHASNIHYLGMKNYEQLPAYLAYFDVGIIPFALNEATQYLSPTKTLEYMAAHKPIVSTPIIDVIQLYGRVVRIGRTPDIFISQIKAALLEDNNLHYAERMKLLKAHTWDVIANKITDIITKKFTSVPLMNVMEKRDIGNKKPKTAIQSIFISRGDD